MELISTFFTLPRGLVYHHQRILKLILNLDLLIYFLVSNDKKISQKLKFSNTYIFATWWCNPLIFQTIYQTKFIVWNINIGLQRNKNLTSKLGAKTQFLLTLNTVLKYWKFFKVFIKETKLINSPTFRAISSIATMTAEVTNVINNKLSSYRESVVHICIQIFLIASLKLENHTIEICMVMFFCNFVW